MRILINCSNLKIGGGLQVAHSFLNEIKSTSYSHFFLIVASRELHTLLKAESFPSNFKIIRYNISPSPLKTIIGRDFFLSTLEFEYNIDKVFSVFGPTYWRPKAKHIVGYAKPHYVYTDSPFFNLLQFTDKIKLSIKKTFHLWDFSRNNDIIITENEDVSRKLKAILKYKRIETVTNYYNQIFDLPNEWSKSIKLPEFDGFSLLTVSANYPHKNLNIIPKVISYLSKTYPAFSFRFIISVGPEVFRNIKDPSILSKLLPIGKVEITQCPYLYQQANAIFLPTLLECFTATYPEAMRMEKPLLTSNLNFATGLCGNAAEYFDPLNPKDIGDRIYNLATDIQRQRELIHNGQIQLYNFDNYKVRAHKYLNIITT